MRRMLRQTVSQPEIVRDKGISRQQFRDTNPNRVVSEMIRKDDNEVICSKCGKSLAGI